MTDIKLALAAVIVELQKNRTEIKKQKGKDTALDTAVNLVNQTLTALQTKLNELASGGLVIPHYGTAQERDTALPAPKEGQVCYVGSSGNWTLNTYENGGWVEGHTSNHDTAADDTTWKQSKQDKLTVAQMAILGGVVFTQAEKDLLGTLNQTYALRTDLQVDDTTLKNLQLDMI